MTTDRGAILITGSASGLGRSVTVALIERGYRVVATDVAVDTLRSLADESGWPDDRVLPRRLDVRDAEAWQAVVEETVSTFGRLDALINNAGYLRPGFFLEQDAAEIERQVDVNARGVIVGTHAAARIMVEQGQGRIVNVGSFAALAPIPGITVYCGSKYAVRGFSLAAAQELRPRGVYVTVVCPESVQTPMLDLEKTCDASAMAFSGPLLSAEKVARVMIRRVLEAKRPPMEVYIPRARGRFARLMDLMPRSASWLAIPRIRRSGLRRQQRLRRKS